RSRVAQESWICLLEREDGSVPSFSQPLQSPCNRGFQPRKLESPRKACVEIVRQWDNLISHGESMFTGCSQPKPGGHAFPNFIGQVSPEALLGVEPLHHQHLRQIGCLSYSHSPRPKIIIQ